MIAFIGNQISEKHMNKRIKWGIILTIGIGLSGLGIYQFTPHENEELTAADALPRENKSKTLKVNARALKKSLAASFNIYHLYIVCILFGYVQIFLYL